MLTALVAGCSSPGVLVNRQEGTGAPKMGIAPEDGNYVLYMSGQGSTDIQFRLKKDQPLGFELQSNGQVLLLIAVAGRNRLPLQVDKTYEWRRL